jgi:glutathione S-transferase
VAALLCHAGLPFRWLPEQGSVLEAQRFAHRRRRVVAGRLPLTWPKQTELDEFPLVPFLFGPAGENLYDSSAIGEWLTRRSNSGVLLPEDDPALRFAVRLLDEAFDEVGLYLVHHNRWVWAARDNGAGGRLAREMRPLLGPAAYGVARVFPARQVRRLPYLFSVADAADRSFDDLPPRLRPPAREGFPPTHGLLDRIYGELIDALEGVLATRPYLFGERFTLADASVIGQVGMYHSDPSAHGRLAERAPRCEAWVARALAGDFEAEIAGGASRLDAAVAPLLAWACRCFVPLMQQNRAAWERERRAGVTRFNEAAFDAGCALYDGTLLDQPFRSVAKTFQVRVWRDLRNEWEALAEDERRRLEELLPDGHGLDRDVLA